MWTGENDLRTFTRGRGSVGNRKNIDAVLNLHDTCGRSLIYVRFRPKIKPVFKHSILHDYVGKSCDP